MTISQVAPWLNESRWPTVPIRFLARLGTGHTPSRQKPEYWEECDIPWITLADVWRLRDGKTYSISDTKEKISKVGLANSAAVQHPAGTVILSRTASVGFSAIMGTDMATSQDFATWTCGQSLNPRYLLHALRAMAPDLKRIAAGSTHKTIYMPDIEQLRIPLPSIAEQRRIADFLDTETARINALENARSTQIELLAAYEQSMLDEVFRDLKSGSATQLKHLFAVRSRYGVLVPQFVEGGVPFIRVNDLQDLEGRADQLRTIPPELSSQYARTVVRPGDLLVSVVGTLGRAAIAPDRLAGANIARAVCSVRVAPNVEVELVQAWLRTTAFQNQALVATSTDTAQPTLGMEDLGNFHLVWPSDPTERQQLLIRIASVQESLTRLRERLARQRTVLAERRQALITAAVTGQIDVSTASGRGVGS